MNISVSRPAQYADRLRAYELCIDGKVVAKINAGETLNLSVPNAAMMLHAKVDWCSSQKVPLATISDGDAIEVRNSFSQWSWIPFMPLYYISIGRKKYLALNKID